MSEFLTVIELVPTKRVETAEFFSTPPQNSITVAPVLAAEDAKSTSSLRNPIDLENRSLKEGRIIVIIASLTAVNFLGSLCNGFLTIGLPKIASDLSLSEDLILWPSAVY